MKKIIFILVLSFFLVPLVSVSMVKAQNEIGKDEVTEGTMGTDNVEKLKNPLPGVTSPQILIGKVIDAALGVVGSLALLMFVFGGITWMTSAGSAEKVKKGRDILVWSAIGLVIVFSAYGLTRVLIKGIGG